MTPVPTALDPRALEALKNNQRQLDMDGVEVGVSRQALDELIAAYETDAPLSQPQAGEPVGYLVQGFDGGPFFATDREQYDRQGHAVVPVYASPQPALAVKGLEWEPGVVDWAQPLPGMKYVACSTTPIGSWAWWLDGAPETRAVLPSETAAKAAAQADYETRIRSSLVAPPPSGEVEALEWAIAEIEGRTRYDNDDQFDNALNEAKKSLSAPTKGAGANMYRAPVDDGELQEWANLRADDAGRLARELINYRRSALSTAPATADGWRTKATDDVLSERKRQIEAEGWTPEHDDSHENGEMAGAAACYALASTPKHWGAPHAAKTFWPWASEWWKPADPRRNLIKAGALILAEIERLDRLPAAPTATGGR